jgi:oligopeptide/dipeptide ABC transporter ATP-binding protein
MNNDTMTEERIPILSVRGLKKYFPIKKGVFRKVVGQVKAVDGISFDIYKGETFGLVGESGCGKTTTGMNILRLQNPTEGKILFNDVDMASMSQRKIKSLRKDIQVIFQDPYSSLDPRMKIKDIVAEGLKIHNIGASREERYKMVAEILEKVGIRKEMMNRFPHEFSGGQRQRIGIARALVLRPKLIVCDEAVSALDVSIQAQVINLLEDIQEEFELTYIFIAHDLSVVKHISNRIGVMYLGKMMELADRDTLFKTPMHPYTKALISAVPIPDPDNKSKRILLQGDVPSPANPPSGCRFHTRCQYAKPICSQKEPKLVELEKDHFVACHLFDKEIDMK